MMSALYIVLALCVGQWVGAEAEGYHQYKLVEITLPSHEQLQAYQDSIDVFSHNGDNITAMVSPLVYNKLKEEFGDSVQLLHNNMQSVAEEDFRQRQRRKRSTTSLEQDVRSYLDLDENFSFQEKLMAAYPSITRKTIGLSYEGNPIYLLKLSSNPTGPRKRTIFIDAGIHAREWIAPAMANYIMYQLSTSAGNLLDDLDFEIVPVLNPDGYRYSFQSSATRFWRKNRQPNAGTSCVGTDLNRNFGYPQHLPDNGGSRSPCSETYSGPSARSANETRVLVNYLNANSDAIVAYLSLHSYGRYILYPYGFDYSVPDDANELQRVGDIGDRASPKTYTVGSSARVLYVAAGGSDDYAKGGAGIKYSYTIELPPQSFNPSSDTVPSLQDEAWAVLKAMFEEINLVSTAPTTPQPTPAPTTPQPTQAPTTPQPTPAPTTPQPTPAPTTPQPTPAPTTPQPTAAPTTPQPTPAPTTPQLTPGPPLWLSYWHALFQQLNSHNNQIHLGK